MDNFYQEIAKELQVMFKSPEMELEAVKLAVKAASGCQSSTEVVKTIRNVYYLLTRGAPINS